VGGVAWLALTQGAPDLPLHMLLGYALLQAMLMLRLLQLIAAQPLSMPYWGFSFGLTAIAQIPLGMVARGDHGAGASLAVVLFIVANAGMAWLIGGTLRLLVSGKILPVASTPATTIPGSQNQPHTATTVLRDPPT
jgi:tellurite resistance protein